MTAHALLEAELPELPEPSVFGTRGVVDDKRLPASYVSALGYTADQMRDYARAAIASSLAEQPAKGEATEGVRTWLCKCGDWNHPNETCAICGMSLPQPSDPADADALKCNHRFKPNAGYPDCDCETEAECMYGATPPTAHPQAPSVDAAAVLALAEVCERKAAEFVKEDDGAAAACCDWFVIQLRALATQQAQPPTAQRHDDSSLRTRFIEILYEEAAAQTETGITGLAGRLLAAIPTHGAGAAVEAVAYREYYEAHRALLLAESDWKQKSGDFIAGFRCDDEDTNEQLRSPRDASFAALGKAEERFDAARAALSTQPLPQPAGVSDEAVTRAAALRLDNYLGTEHGVYLGCQAAIAALQAALHPEQAKDGAAG